MMLVSLSPFSSTTNNKPQSPSSLGIPFSLGYVYFSNFLLLFAAAAFFCFTYTVLLLLSPERPHTTHSRPPPLIPQKCVTCLCSSVDYTLEEEEKKQIIDDDASKTFAYRSLKMLFFFFQNKVKKQKNFLIKIECRFCYVDCTFFFGPPPSQ